jgi:hypothetical protein
MLDKRVQRVMNAVYAAHDSRLEAREQSMRGVALGSNLFRYRSSLAYGGWRAIHIKEEVTNVIGGSRMFIRRSFA